MVAVIGMTAAYFSVNVMGNDDASSIVTTTANLGNITFTDGNEISAIDIYPGWSATKTFTIANTEEGANNQISYAILLYEEINTITYNAEGAFIYSLSGTTSNGGTIISITEHPVPDAEGAVSVISDMGVLNGEDTHTYTFTISLNETDMDQNAIQGKIFEGIIQVDVATITGYRTWDSLAGTWKAFMMPAAEECFEFDSETGEIIGYNYSNPTLCPTAFEIPGTINGVLVTKIADSAFYIYRGGAVSYKGDSPVLNIENTIFYNDDYNISGMFTNGPEPIKLTGVKIPESVTEIGYQAFFNNNISDLILPDSLITIGEGAFQYNNLTSLTLPDTVTTIGPYAFDDNQISGELDLSGLSSLTTLTEGAFASNSIEILKLPTSIVNIGDVGDDWGPFDSNGTITTVNFDDLVNLEKIGTYGFYYSLITSADFSNSTKLEIIGDMAFEENHLTSLELANSVTTIGESAFEENQLTSLTLPNSVTTVANKAFRNNELTTITLSTGLTSIGDYAFADNLLTALTIPSNITIAPYNAFSDNQLTSITLPEALEIIENAAFANNLLTTVTIPSSVTDLEYWSFGSNQLTSVCIRGKSNPLAFSTYGDPEGWADGYSALNIIWNCTN